ncbi:MAG: hypothetical protein ACR2GK_01470 [Gemmatimonadaceae bacterium]
MRTDTEKGAGKIEAVNPEEGWLEITIGNRQAPFAGSFALVPSGPLMDAAMRGALKRFGEAVFEGRAEEFPAVMSILRKEKPRLHDTTFTSAHAIVALLEKGKRIGVMSQSHKAINNLLKAVEEVAENEGVKFSGVKKSSHGEQRLDGRMIEETGDNKAVFGGNHQLIGGTAWLFSCPEMVKRLDYLFIDEAGQVSLADVVASGLAARNIVLVGDQMQLLRV